MTTQKISVGMLIALMTNGVMTLASGLDLYERYERYERARENLSKGELNEPKILMIPIIPLISYIVTSEYGSRRDPFNNDRIEFHHGIDMGCKLGSSIRAINDGVILDIRTDKELGLHIKQLTHDRNHSYEFTYAHMQSVNVSINDVVKQYATIGFVGMTGKTTGPHLHLNVKIDGRLMNPRDFYKAYNIII